MKSCLQVVEAGVRRIDRLLGAADRRALHAKVDPLLKRYRARKGKDDALLRKIVAAFRAYPRAYWPLLRGLHRIDPKRWKKPVAKGRAKIRKLRRPLKKKAARKAPPGGGGLGGAARTGGAGGAGYGAGKIAATTPLSENRGQRAKPPLPGASRPVPARQPEKPRWIIAEAHDLEGGLRGEALRAFRAGGEHEIRVHIGAHAKKGQVAAKGRSAKDSVVPEGKIVDLTVAFFIPALGHTDSKPLQVPAYGDSKAVAFRFKAGEAGSKVEAFVSLVHGGRVLQTAILAGDVVADPALAPAQARVTLRLQIVVPGFREAARRKPFGATVLAARHPAGRAAAAGVGAGKVVLFDSPALDGAGSEVRKAIAKVVDEPDNFRGKLDAERSRRLLWELAQYGVLLYDAIGRKLTRDLAGEDLSRLQIVQASADVFIPLEFVYELAAPANDAPLCPRWLEGKACTSHDQDALGRLKHVCPSGFWGLSKVIERQALGDVSEEDLSVGRGFGIRVEPTEKRPSLPPPSGALFAWSAILDNVVGTTSKDLLKALNDATAGQAVAVATWEAWATDITNRRPSLLVLLSHTVTTQGPAALEIGPEDGAERVTLGQINELLVRKDMRDTPIVILLGCDTAVGTELTTFAGRFRDKGAAVVVGTITPVLGEHSAEVVKALLAELAEAARRPRQPSFGELMRDVRRSLLAKGELTALCATSFGDADWGIGRAAA